MIKKMLLSACILAVAGCATQSINLEPVNNSFSVSKYNKNHIKKRISKNPELKYSIAVDDFTLVKNSKIDKKFIYCSAITLSRTNITYPESVETYLKKILIEKLKSSKLYTENPENADTVISGEVKGFALYEEVAVLGEFQSLDLEIELKTNHGKSITIKNIGSETLFWHESGIEGCRQYAKNIQQWINKAFEKPFTKQEIEFLYPPKSLAPKS